MLSGNQAIFFGFKSPDQTSPLLLTLIFGGVWRKKDMKETMKNAVRLSGSKNMAEICKKSQSNMSDEAQSNCIGMFRGLRENFRPYFTRLFNDLNCSEHIIKYMGGF